MCNRFVEKRRRYLREHGDGIYTGMLLTGKLDASGKPAEDINELLIRLLR